jgi:hypothetical protein
MLKAEKTVKTIATAGIVVGFIAFFLSFALFAYWSSISPTAPDPATGRTCSLSDHGYIFYVTKTQTMVFHALLLGGWSLGACGIVLRLLKEMSVCDEG